MNTRIFKAIGGAIVTGALLVPSIAEATSVTYECVGSGPTTVADGAPGQDLEPLPNQIRVTVKCGVPNQWRASGEIKAVYDPVANVATTVARPLTITSLSPGGVIGGVFRFTHEFPPGLVGAVSGSSSIDGVFSNSTLTFIGLAMVNYQARAKSTSMKTQIDTDGTGVISGAPPIPFSFSAAGVPLLWTNTHEGEINFYLEKRGDFIQLQPGGYFSISTS